ncbi:MAG: protease pro-enzyme activation domain-containing protein [Bryobacteraceae bacterium]
MAFEKRITLPGSERKPLRGSQKVGTVDPAETVRVTIVLRRKGAAPAVATGNGAPAHLTREQFIQRHGADPNDIALVEKFAHQFQLTVVESSARKRRVVLTGSAAAMAKAFEVEFVCYKVESTGHNFRGRSGSLSIPTELQGLVVAVLGLDTRPIAKPHMRRTRIQARALATSYTPPQVAELYNFPTGVTGSGQTIAIIELGGGYSTTDLQTYFSGLGINEPNVTAVSVDGGQNSPGSDADAEVMLDIEVAGSIASGANIAVYFTPNTDQGFIDAITDAVHDTTRNPSVVSISWGGPEDSWTAQSQTAMNGALEDASTLGVTVTIAAGDNGSSDGETDGNLHVDFPASSPYALACGGTTLTGSGSSISSEVVWNETANNEGATGGGVSNVFALPSYQSAAGVPAQPETNFVGRGVPDVAGDADPSTGYQVLVDGQSEVVGGTSAVAPLWAALVALMNQQLGSNVGFLNPKLYPLGESVFNDITSGNNDDSGLGYYSAQTGWDPCTGLGSPNGTALLDALSSSTTSSARVALPGSTPQQKSSDTMSEIPNPEQQEVTASLILRRSSGSGASKPTAKEATSADPNDVTAVCAFAEQYGLTIQEKNVETRTVRIKGTVQQMDEAFGVELCWITDSNGNRHLSYMGPLSIPKSLSGVVTAVLGLDQRPIAKHHTAR